MIHGKIKISRLIIICAIVPLLTVSGCKMTYNFTGVLISPDVKTFTVYYFPNRARSVNPTLSNDFVEKLKDTLTRQSSLSEQTDNGDLMFEGQITEYDVRPMAIQKDDLAAKNRLTVGVKLKFTNNKDHEQDFERTFTSYEDFDGNRTIMDVESDLVPTIIENLVSDIINATIANW